MLLYNNIYNYNIMQIYIKSCLEVFMQKFIDVLFNDFSISVKLFIFFILMSLIGQFNVAIILGIACIVNTIVQLVIYLKTKKDDKTIEEYNQNMNG